MYINNKKKDKIDILNKYGNLKFNCDIKTITAVYNSQTISQKKVINTAVIKTSKYFTFQEEKTIIILEH